jgi:hypothetical protein
LCGSTAHGSPTIDRERSTEGCWWGLVPQSCAAGPRLGVTPNGGMCRRFRLSRTNRRPGRDELPQTARPGATSAAIRPGVGTSCRHPGSGAGRLRHLLRSTPPRCCAHGQSSATVGPRLGRLARRLGLVPLERRTWEAGLSGWRWPASVSTHDRWAGSNETLPGGWVSSTRAARGGVCRRFRISGTNCRPAGISRDSSHVSAVAAVAPAGPASSTQRGMTVRKSPTTAHRARPGPGRGPGPGRRPGPQAVTDKRSPNRRRLSPRAVDDASLPSTSTSQPRPYWQQIAHLCVPTQTIVRLQTFRPPPTLNPALPSPPLSKRHQPNDNQSERHRWRAGPGRAGTGAGLWQAGPPA